MLLKICGLKETKTIDCCLKNKVNFFGMIFYKKSPRYINMLLAKKLINYSNNKKIIPVGVFVNENLITVKSIINKLDLKMIQLHGEENDEYINEIKKIKDLTIIKSIPVRKIKDLKKIKNYQLNDYFLFDYKPEISDLPGGNSKKFDWSILNGLRVDKPWFLSGGINISNIHKIKNFANPDGIDLSSGVEEFPGIKNLKMINNLFKKYYAN